jgi:glycosyltransferase involved in cell wall biosynthesis
MNIWVIVDYEPVPLLDGDCKYLRNGQLAMALANRGHTVTWWTGDFDHVRKRHRRQVSNNLAVQRGLTVRLLPSAGYRKNISFRRVLHNVRLASAFETQVAGEQPPELIFVCLHALELAEAVAAYATRNGVTLVVDVVDLWPDVFLTALPKAIRSVGRVLLQTEYRRARRILRSAAAVTAVSQTYLDWALNLSGRTRGGLDGVFPLGCSSPDGHDAQAIQTERSQLQLRHGLTPDSFNVAFVGQLSHSYDLDTVLQAAKLLRGRYHGRLRFLIAGDGKDRERLERSGRNSGNVTFTGWLPAPAVRAILGLSSAGLAAYARHATQSLPYKIFEYMAAGLPLVSCLSGEVATMISTRRIGLQYTAGVPESLAGCLERLLDQPEECAEMGRAARERFEGHYNSEVVYRGLSRHLERLHDGAAVCVSAGKVAGSPWRERMGGDLYECD